MAIKVTIELTEEQIKTIVQSGKINKTPDTPLTYSLAKASRIIGISKSTMQRRIKEGSITTIKVGKMPRITRTEINSFLFKH
jgi:excisionase family DNA binding protein